ncbi:hypothetical protein [Limoniibacter endophyticus]|uniref:hypothetical protein n=1 Tax=Limoniibacter endophyticus TaxID=1565040 RepID=UPI001671EFBD|nr:hypothetical protein [Limoniibacter endophyticus]
MNDICILMYLLIIFYYYMDITLIQIVCAIWGQKYNDNYVNKIYRQITCKTTEEFRFICLSDRQDRKFDAGIEIASFSTLGTSFEMLRVGCRAKLSIFDCIKLDPDKVTIFFDLDTMIIGDVALIAQQVRKRPGIYMLPNHLVPHWRCKTLVSWLFPKMYYFANSSVIGFYPKQMGFIAEQFREEFSCSAERNNGGSSAQAKHFGGDDRYISYAARKHVRVLSNRLAVKYTDEYMSLSATLSALKSKLPWVRKRRANLVAVTYQGDVCKPENLVRFRAGSLVRYKHYRCWWADEGRSEYWSFLENS